MLTDLRRFKSGSVSGPLRFVHFTSIPLARIGQSLDRAALNRRGGYSRDRSACALIDWLWVPFIILPNKRLLFHQNLDPIALYPLDAAHGTKEIRDRLEAGVASNVYPAPGPDGNIDSSYEFLGTSTNYIEFPNGAGLDAKNSMTMLCWLFPGGQDGPLFNYRNTGSWGVHLWVVAGRLFVRFTKRDYSFTNALLHTELKPEDGWKFVGASYDSSSGDARLWVDGNEVQKLNIGTNLLLATQDSVRMGVKIGDGRFFKGRIAQMQVYNVALSQEQIQAIRSKTQVAGKQVI